MPRVPLPMGILKTCPKSRILLGSPSLPMRLPNMSMNYMPMSSAGPMVLETIGLRYFNVFGRKQDPNGAYAAVIPKFVMQMMKHEAPVINGDGSFSRDFTYIDNVVQMNIRAMLTKIAKL